MLRPGAALRRPLLWAYYWSGPVRDVVYRDLFFQDVPIRGSRRLDRASLREFDRQARRPEWRTLFFYRLRTSGSTRRILGGVLRRIYGQQDTLFVHCPEIGPGLHFRHGFATIVDAASVGADCLISQQVTIGWSEKGGPPVLGDRVQVLAGAKVLGPVTIGDDAVIGANAVVLTDVPARAVMVGVPARNLRETRT